ncbi:MAG: GerMN domain-containing protein [Thermodesulfovibrionales bacterium]
MNDLPNRNTSNNRKVWIVLIVVFFLAGAAATYVFLTRFAPPATHSADVRFSQSLPAVAEDLVPVRLSIPHRDRVETIEKRVPKKTRVLASAEAVVDEFLKTANGADDVVVPAQAKLLGVYRDTGRTLIVDFSDEFRRNFQGDVLAEYLLLRAFFETMTATIPDIEDVKILIEGKEIDTLGGHFPLKFPLRGIVGAAAAAEGSGRDD